MLKISTLIFSIRSNNRTIFCTINNSFIYQKTYLLTLYLYVHKNKVYADLETVDLSKVEGYEEAVKLVEDMKDDMGMKENIKDYLF